MRVGILGLQHESNTFVSTPTTLSQFEQEVIASGEAVRDFYGRIPHEIGGFFAGLEDEGIEAVPIFAASAYPAGAVTGDTIDELLKRMFAALEPVIDSLDGLLVAPHGAGVSETYPDMDGHWLTLVREKLGPDKPIVCTIDPHANVSEKMIAACNATISYRSNPHLDQKDRGIEAARLIARTLRGEVQPTQAVAMPAIAISIEKQCTDEQPCLNLLAKAAAMRDRAGVLSVSIVLGFPYSDVAEMGSSFIVVTDNDPTLAGQYADELAGWLTAQRRDFVANLIDVETALDRVMTGPRPACLLDMGDNVGGGSAADGTWIAHAVHARGSAGNSARVFVAIADEAAAAKARDAGVGATVTLSVGGKTDDLHGPPLEATFTVVSLHDGRFVETQVRHGGKANYDMGPTAIVRSETGLTIQITSRRVVPFSLVQVTSCGLDPADFDALVAKGVNAPVAAYAPVCPRFIRVNTGGSTTADMTALPYQHRRRPLFPLEEIG